MRRITVEEFHAELRAQGVANHNDAALKCPICATVQSMNSLISAGLKPEEAERYIGFSCEGRFLGAKAAKRGKPASKLVRGCDWTLGGLFKLHTLEIVTPDGRAHPRFEVATPEEAQALAKRAEQRVTP